MIDVLVIVLAVGIVALVVVSQRTADNRKRSRRTDVLTALAPVVGGSVSAGHVLTGRYRGYDIEASLHTTVPNAPNSPGSGQARASVETVRVRLPGTPGAQPWSVWRAPTFHGWTWHFARSDGSDFLPLAGALGRLAGLPPVDPGLPDRLRAAGILEAFEHLGPPTRDSLPHIEFRSDLRPLMLERFRGREIPASALDASRDAGSSLEVEVELASDPEPTPEAFHALLDAAVAIAEINARANPATTA